MHSSHALPPNVTIDYYSFQTLPLLGMSSSSSSQLPQPPNSRAPAGTLGSPGLITVLEQSI